MGALIAAARTLVGKSRPENPLVEAISYAITSGKPLHSEQLRLAVLLSMDGATVRDLRRFADENLELAADLRRRAAELLRPAVKPDAESS